MFVVEINASNAGVNYGGLTSTEEIQILICYIIDSINEPIPGQQLSELLHYEGIANYFEVVTAFSALCAKNHIIKNGDNYTITESGRNIAKTLKTSVSLSVRNKVYALTVKMLAKIKYINDTAIDITPMEGGYNIKCAVVEGNVELMSVSLFVTDKAQANQIKNLFLEDPTKVYSGIIGLLTDTEI